MTNSTFKASSLLIALLSPFLSISQVQADSVEEWAYWNASPQFDPKGFQFVYNSNPTTAEQTRIGNNQGNLVEPTGATETDWVGYSLASYCSSDSVYSSNKLGDIALVPVNGVGTDNDRLLYSDDGPASLLLNLSGTGDENLQLEFDGGDGSFSVSSGKESRLALRPASGSSVSISTGFGTDNDKNQDFIGQKTFNTFSFNEDFSEFAFGDIVIGKLMPLNNIASAVAAVARGDLRYGFNGTSVLGSAINITVNFTQASWDGYFGGISSGPEPYNGYSAAGTIAGNTLTGNVSTGGDVGISARGYAPSGTVVSGQITGRLVGELGVSDMGTAGIIGKSELMVQPVSRLEMRVIAPPELVPVNDIFMLGSGFDD